jgi:aspartate racemase
MGKVIGIVGGISWESTAEYYRLFNQLANKSVNAWQQPPLLIDSLDFGVFVPLTHEKNWKAVDEHLLESAKRLVAGGAKLIILGANTAHISFDAIQKEIPVPMVDIRVAIANQVKSLGANSLALLGTQFVMNENFYQDKLRELGIEVVTPISDDQAYLQNLIYQELTRGVFREESRQEFIAIAQRCIDRGAQVVGLCCTEFGLLLGETEVPFQYLDSTRVHVEATLEISEITE